MSNNIEEQVIQKLEAIKVSGDKGTIYNYEAGTILNFINKLKRNTCTYEQTDIDYNSWTCSKCKCDWCLDEGNPKDNNLNYCPECGARIENFIEYEEVEEDE